MCGEEGQCCALQLMVIDNRAWTQNCDLLVVLSARTLVQFMELRKHCSTIDTTPPFTPSFTVGLRLRDLFLGACVS